VTDNPSLPLIKALLHSQVQGTLAVLQSDGPKQHLMAFASRGIDEIWMATDIRSGKYKDIRASPKVSFLIDDRAGKLADHFEALVGSVTGALVAVETPRQALVLSALADRHPNLRQFFSAETTIALCLDVHRWHIVRDFEHVSVYEPNSGVPPK